MDWTEPKRPSWFNLRVVAWALFDLGATIFSMLAISRYLGPWVVDEKGGTEAELNLSMSLSMAIAAILQILLSPISDEWGRRRVFVIFFTIVCAAACAGMSGAPTLGTGLLLFVVANIGYQVASVFYSAMLDDVSDERHRARVSGIGVGLGYVGSIIGLLLSEKLVRPDINLYSPVFEFTAVAFFVFALPLFLFVPEKPSLVRLNFAQSLTNSIGAFATTLRRVWLHRELLFFFIGCLLALDAVHTVIFNMALYCKTVVGLDPVKPVELPFWSGVGTGGPFQVSEMNLFLITSTVCAIFGAFGIGHIADKTDHYRMLLAILVLWMVALVLAMFSVQRTLFWLIGPLFGLALGGIWTVSRAYLLDICHPEERGQMFALYGLVGRGAAILGPAVWAGVVTLFRPEIGERKAYRLAIGAMLLLMALGFWVILLARPRSRQSWRRWVS